MTNTKTQSVADPSWLKSYYAMRAGFSILWIVAAVVVGRNAPAIAAVLLIAYPAWDAVANLMDARRSGGVGRNPSQAVNAAASTVTALAVAYALGLGLHAVLAVIGTWAIAAGILQLVTGVRRWSTGAQWAMILSGAQSAVVGGFMIRQAGGPVPATIMDVVPYAGFGAFYFVVSAIWLTVKRARTDRYLSVA